MNLIISEPSFQEVHLSSLVAISLFAFGFCHLATKLSNKEANILSPGEEADCI